MNWSRLVELGLALPETALGTSYGTPGVTIRDKGFVRLKEDGVTVVFLTSSVDEQEALIAALPEVFYITDHYRGYPAVLARLAKLTTAVARERLETAYRVRAPKRLAALLDADAPGAAAKPARRTTRRRGTRRARPRARP